MNTEIATKSFLPAPTTFEEAWRLSQVLADSDLVPKDFRGKPGNCMIAMQWGSDLGIPGIQALQNIAIINGRPSIWGDAAKALVIGRADCEDIQEFFDGDTAVCIVKRKGRSPVTSRFGLTDAKSASLLGKPGPWTQYRNRMLQMRARGFALRDAFPDALRGLSIAEEAQDMPIEKEINPPETKTEEALKGLNKKHEEVIDYENYLPLDNAIKAIQTIDSKESQATAKAIIEQLSPEDKLTAKDFYKKRCAQLKTKPKNNVDWEKEIKQCGDKPTLMELLKTMPENIQTEFGIQIDDALIGFEI